MTMNGGQATGLFFIFGWRGRDATDGPYYVNGASTAERATDLARAALKTWRRTRADDVRTNDVVWDSATKP